ncbi:FecR family protein [Mucilaginibacter paludis]|uniref:Anti-FecI sigma factor, FecR n=1 Tax=Mucilaginibacter paludis DSM 18603 TaxID=714943 RepID=H1YBV5_9SPHI|nr:FecR family protein [Mucilaginibacter paludis]EHQ27033.1 anti-FecI sigma factor, FecR [Mucilaginibacter paludis DSM 18603]
MEEKPSITYITELARKWRTGTLSEEEQGILDQWYSDHQDELLPLPEGSTDNPYVIKDRMMKQIFSKIEPEHKTHFIYTWKYYIVAASVLLVISIGTYFYLQNTPVHVQEQSFANIDAAPGGNKAVLTLANGTKISLTSAKNGELSVHDGISVTKTADGKLVYTIKEKSGSTGAPAGFNTIETPAGGQYLVVLPDGSQVFLNASSKLTYPERFAVNERRVSLEGEGYFEVSHNKARPFKVISNDQEVRVLGTTFNVNAYADEHRIITTLATGSVEVSSAQFKRSIIPGQQAINTPGQDIHVQQADLKTALAWKDGWISFKDADLHSIMRQLSRWYNIKIRYNGAVTGDIFNGVVSRSSTLNEVLEVLKEGNIKFKLEEDKQEGKTLIIN